MDDTTSEGGAMEAARERAGESRRGGGDVPSGGSAAWLAFYNGLNDQQKTTVSTALKQQFARMEQRHEKMKERWQQHRAAKAASAPAQ